MRVAPQTFADPPLSPAAFRAEGNRQLQKKARELFWLYRGIKQELAIKLAAELDIPTTILARECEIFDPALSPAQRTLETARRLFAERGLRFPVLQ